MSFASLKTLSFRNLADCEINVNGKDIFIVGENGQGKTNFLEALYFCSYASSFRGVRDRKLVRTGEKDCSVSVTFNDSLHSTVNVSFKDGKKSIQLDGKKVEDRKDLLSVAPSVVFCYEDMEFVSGTPERRRWFFDQTRSLWDALYLDDLRNYRVLVKSRNALFRKDGKHHIDAETTAILDAIDPQMVQYGIQLTEKRQKTAEEFSQVFEPLYRDISGISGIGVQYNPSWKNTEPQTLIDHLYKRRDLDFSFGSSLSGPHRDNYLFTCNGEDFSTNASTGQRRLLALLLRVAQSRIFLQRTGKKPVLMFDDVLLELDAEKRRKFFSLMPEYEQAFYTFLPGEYDNYLNADTIVYTMNAGSVQRKESLA